MEEHHLFKFLWRFNAVVIGVAGVLATGVLLFVAYGLIRDVTREESTQNVVNLVGSVDVEESWRLGQFYNINDGEVLMLPLHSDQLFDFSYTKKSASSARNYLFINTETLDKKWLFNHTNYLVERSERLRAGDLHTDGPERPVVAILYHVVPSDSDQDTRLSTRDLKTVSISRPDGSGYRELISEVDSVVDQILVTEDKLLLSYQKSGVAYIATIDPQGREIVKNEKLPDFDSHHAQ